jgi:phytanoyl-CoA hydroxylase
MIPWHQDKSYWNTTKVAGSVWLTFDDVNEENGAMYVLPQWHKFKDLPRRKTADDLFEEEIVPELLPTNINQLEVGYFLRAGEAGVHDPQIPHRSTANASNRWRRVLVCRYMRADGDMAEMQYPDYRTGQMIQRKYLLVRGNDIGRHGLERI